MASRKVLLYHFGTDLFGILGTLRQRPLHLEMYQRGRACKSFALSRSGDIQQDMQNNQNPS
jgi:hypothetical protein